MRACELLTYVKDSATPVQGRGYDLAQQEERFRTETLWILAAHDHYITSTAPNLNPMETNEDIREGTTSAVQGVCSSSKDEVPHRYAVSRTNGQQPLTRLRSLLQLRCLQIPLL